MVKIATETLVVAAVLRRRGEVLIVRRGPAQSGAGFWEFPGGKVEAAESPEQALAREIQEELGVLIRIEGLIGEVVHTYPQKKIRLRLFWASPLSESLVLSEHDDFKWLRPHEINIHELSEADRYFVAQIIAQIEST
jgi:mutator protein MutT